jgi:N-formylglutamate amidohydrolase
VDKIWSLHESKSPVISTAIHNGHNVRPEVAELLALSDSDRLREEDPFTSEWAAIADTRIIGLHSRFEVDLNRPRDRAVYIHPDDAWGLKVWKTEPSPDLIARSLEAYDAFYYEVREVLKKAEHMFGHFVVLDIHSYNHVREGQGGAFADPDLNPEVNVGTGTMDRERWAPVVERFIADLREFDFLGRHLDVRENVRFRGGNFPRWIHETFPKTGCALAVEMKKFFMNEWTGKPAPVYMKAIHEALKSAVNGIIEELSNLR